METNENLFEFVKVDATASEHIAAPKYSYWKSVFRKFFASKVAIACLIISSIIIIPSIAIITINS